MIGLTKEDYEEVLGTCHVSEENIFTCYTHHSRPAGSGVCSYFNRISSNLDAHLHLSIDRLEQELESKINSITSVEPYLKKFCTSEQVAFERGRRYAFEEVLNLLTGRDVNAGLTYPYEEEEE